MLRQDIILVSIMMALLVMAKARPDSAGQPPLPGPGLSYGGIPYGSMSGNVAEYYKRHAPSGDRTQNIVALGIDYTPIEQWL